MKLFLHLIIIIKWHLHKDFKGVRTVFFHFKLELCIDNEPMEKFLGIIKSEMYHLNDFYSTEALKKAIHAYMSFYNHQRLSPVIKGLRPIE